MLWVVCAARLEHLTDAYLLSCFCLPESLHKEVQDLAFLDVVSKLRSHENKSVAQQASLTEQRLAVESWELPLPDTPLLSPLSSIQLPLLLHPPPHHLCMRVTFQCQLKNCCRYLPNKISKPIVSVNMNLSRISLHPSLFSCIPVAWATLSRMCML